jgi:hypothetical protein
MRRVRAHVPVLVVVLAIVLTLLGCTAGEPRRDSSGAPRPTPPAPADLASPESAVSSYLDWTSYAYAIGNSDVASNTMGANEEVRVNSFVQLNKEKKRRISQILASFKARPASVEDTRATLEAEEVWNYRYLSADGARAISETYTASYETTYHVVLVKPGTWVVDSVEALPLDEVR